MSSQDTIAHNLLCEGKSAFANKKISLARQLFKKSLYKKRVFETAFLLGMTYAQQNILNKAAEYFHEATLIDPKLSTGHYNLGYALQLLKKFPEAKKAYCEALNIEPSHHEALHNLAVVYEELGELDEAISHFERAIATNPNCIEPFYNLGSLLIKIGKYDEAIKQLTVALERNTNHLQALKNRGLVLMIKQRWSEAFEDFSKAASLNPADAELHFNKGQVAMKWKRLEVAEASYSAALEIDPNYADALINKAFALEQMSRYADASVCFEKFIRIKPDAAFVPGYLLSSRLHLCDWHNYDAATENILRQLQQQKAVITPHSVTILPSTRKDQKIAAEIWAELKYGSINSIPFTKNARSSSEKIRIGYFSSDYHNHPVSILVARLLEMHDRKKFEIYAFSMGAPSRDSMRLRVEKSVDHFINIRELSDMDAVERIRAEDIDIAIDMTGYTADNRAALFALRVAPIQINFLGYSATMGAKFMDYIIGDPIVIPICHDDDYTEKVIRLPDCYMPSDPTRQISDRPLNRSMYNLPEEKFVFCGFNNAQKISPKHFGLWMDILTGAPDSVLWLSSATAGTVKNLKKEASLRNVNPDRLIFANREDKLADHLARHKLADLFLDTLPHNAHATANDALWAGLPILTCLGNSFSARVAGSLLNAIGMPDMIAANESDYVEKAIEIATKADAATVLKKRLSENKSIYPLFDINKYTKNLERAFERVVNRNRTDLPPESFSI